MALNFLPRPMEGSFCSSGRVESFDVVDLLPDDPFGMNVGVSVNSDLSAMLVGLIELLKDDYDWQWGLEDCCSSPDDIGYYWSGGYSFNKTGFSASNIGYEDLLGCLPYAEPFGSTSGKSNGVSRLHSMGEFGYHVADEWCVVDSYPQAAFDSYPEAAFDSYPEAVFDSYPEAVSSDSDSGVYLSEDFVWVCGGTTEDLDTTCRSETRVHIEEGSSSGASELVHDGLLFALPYMGVKELLAVEMCCKTLQSAVQNDLLLWRCIHISEPLNERLTDEALWQLTQRAEGNLHCLNLVDCKRITNDGLKHVLESNRKITKLNIQGCGRLTADGLVDSFKLFRSPGHLGIKHLMISGIFATKEEHYEDLISLLNLDVSQQSRDHKPRYYHVRPTLHSCDYDCALDVELCPKCQCLRLLYDCPAESCRVKTSEPCRACSICIPRCFFCGRCVTDDEYEETFYLDYICSTCNVLVQNPNRPETSIVKLSPSLTPGAEQATNCAAVE